MKRAFSALLLLAAATGAGPSLGRAQGDSPARASPRAERNAHQDFTRGLKALRAGDFPRARELLRSSLETHPTPATAFNLAVALRGTGRSVAAADLLDALLAGEYGTLEPKRQNEARKLLESVRADIATLHVRVKGASRIEVRIDGETVGRVEDGEQVRARLDAGAHVVSARARGREPAEQRVSLERGKSRQVTLQLQPMEQIERGVLDVSVPQEDTSVEIVGVARDADHLRRELPAGDYTVRIRGPQGGRESTIALIPGQQVKLTVEPKDDSLARNRWLWVGLGAAALALAGGVTAGVLLSGDDSQQQQPVRNPVFGGTIETLESAR